MKCNEANTDREAEVSVRTDSQPCTEYNSHIDDEGALCSYVAVEAGQKISVVCKISGKITQAYLGLVVDGTLRNTKVLNNNSGRAFSRSEILEFAWRKHEKIFRKATMQVAPLRMDSSSSQSEREDIGIIEVRISVLRIADETHLFSGLKFEEANEWVEGHFHPVEQQVAPTHAIQLVSEEVASDATKATISRVRKEIKAPRPGSEPWATLKFYYRSEAAIQSAGFEISPNTSIALDVDPVPDNVLASIKPGTSVYTDEGCHILPKTIQSATEDDYAPAVVDVKLTPPPSDLKLSAPSAHSSGKTTKRQEEPSSDTEPHQFQEDIRTSTTKKTTPGPADGTGPSQMPTPVVTPEKPKLGGDLEKQRGYKGDDQQTLAPVCKPTVNGSDINGQANGVKRAGSVSKGTVKRTKANFSTEEALLAEKLKLRDERRKKRLEARQRADDVEMRRKAALQRQLEQLERDIEEEERLAQEAEEDRLRSEAALAGYDLED